MSDGSKANGCTAIRLLAIDAKSGKLLWDYQTEGSKQDPMKMLKPDGGLNNEAIYARYFGDYQDMVLAFIECSPSVRSGLHQSLIKGWSILAAPMGSCMPFTESCE